MNIKNLPQIEGFDFDYAMNIFQDEDILQMILVDFYHSLDEMCEKLNALYSAIGEGDNLASYRLEVHALKSTSASVGALGISGEAKLLEEAAISRDVEKIILKHPLLMDDVKRVKERLMVIIPGEEEKVTAKESLKPCFEKMKEHLLDFDINEADALCKEVCQYQFPDMIQGLVDELSNQIFRLDTDEAIETIDRILELEV